MRNLNNYETPIDEQNDIPNEFVCPISKIIMTEPMITVDGYTFQKEAIEKWLKRKNTNPMTNKILQSTYLINNRALKEAISYYKTRSNITNQSVKNLIDKQYQYLNDNIPYILDDYGLIDIAKIIRIAIENSELRQAITEIRESLEKIYKTERSQKLQKGQKTCNNCIKHKTNNEKLWNILKTYTNIIQSPPTIHKVNTQVTTFNYFPLSIEFLKKIDFRSTTDKNLSLFKSYNIQNLPLSKLIQRIKMVQKIPAEHFTRLWRVTTPISYILKKIEKDLQNQPYPYIEKIKEFGTQVLNLKVNIQELKLQANQYLIIEHGIDGKKDIRGRIVQCDHCFDRKQEKFICKECSKVSYCCANCAEKDSKFHLKHCLTSKIISIESL